MRGVKNRQISEVSTVVRDSIETVLEALNPEKDRVEKEVEDHINQHPTLKRDEDLLKSIPGIGPIVSRCLLSVLRSRSFDKAQACATCSGLVPVVRESGSSVRGRAKLSKAGSGIVRAKLYMSAIVAIRYNPDARDLYQHLLKRGKPKMSAPGAVMKLVHICFAVLKHQKAYCPRVT